MRAHVNVQDRAMSVPQGRSRLRVMLVSGVMCQRQAPDLMGRAADKGWSNHRGDRDREATVVARESKGGETTDATDANGEQGEGERKGRQLTDYITMNGNQRCSAERRGQ